MSSNNRTKLPGIHRSIEGAFNKKDKPDKTVINYNNLTEISKSIKSKLKHNDDIITLFSDIELCIQLLSSSIISPNDMMETALYYDMSDPDISNTLNAEILQYIRTYINDNFELEDKLMTIIREAYFTRGAYITAHIPTGDILKMMSTHVSNESGVSEYVPLKSNSDKDIEIDESLFFTVEDNVTHMYNKNKDIDRLILGNESFIPENITTITPNIDTVELTDDPCLELKLPVTSTVVVHAPNNPEKHVGYFVLLDSNYMPVDTVSSSKIPDPKSALETRVSSYLIERSKEAIADKEKPVPTIKNLEEIYTSIVTETIENRLADSKYSGMSVVSSDVQVMANLMFMRALKNNKSVVMFIPADLVTYFAFEYRDNGTGISMLEKNSTLYSIRAILLFTRLVANSANSIPSTRVEVELDEHDPDPESTKAMITSKLLAGARNKLPLGASKISDISEWAALQGITIDVKHPNLPNINISKEDTSGDRNTPDTDFEESIRDQTIMGLGLTPDLIEDSGRSDLATRIVSRNILLAKRVSKLQKKLCKHTTKYVKSILRTDNRLRNGIKEIIMRKSNRKHVNSLLKSLGIDTPTIKTMFKDNTAHYPVLELYIRKITTTLPKISDGEEFGTTELFDAYVSSVDSALDYCLNEESMSEELVGLVGEKIDFIKSSAKSVLVRNWMRKNNYLVEMLDMFTIGKGGEVVEDYLAEHAEHTKTLVDVVLRYLKTMENTKRKSDVIVEKIEGGDNDDEERDTDTAGDESEDTSGNISGDEVEGNDNSSKDSDDVGSDKDVDKEMDDLIKV